MSSETPSAPWLSIITVCRNIEGEVAATGASVAAQTFRDFEWIVVDGASTDGTLARLEPYRDRMAVLISEPDRNLYHAMNKGIARARGRYLLFLNGGDWLFADTSLARVFDRAGGCADADILYADIFLHYPESGLTRLAHAPDVAEVTPLFFARGTIWHQAALIRKTLFDQDGLYDESYAIGADWERFAVFAKAGRSFAKLPEPFSVFRHDGMSTRKDTRQPRRDEAERLRAQLFTPEECQQALREAHRRARYRRTFHWGGPPAFSLFSILEKPFQPKRWYRILNLPVLKVEGKPGEDRYRLFGVLPVRRVKNGRAFPTADLPAPSVPKTP